MKVAMMLSVLCLVSILGAAQGQAAPPKAHVAPAWMTSAWTTDEAAYRSVEADLKKDIRDGKNMESVAEDYRKRAASQPNNALAQFAWACSTRAAAKLADPSASTPEAALTALQRADPKNVHEFTLMRFVITQESQPDTPLLYVVGERLMHYDPHDEFIKMPAIYALCRANKYTTALSYAQAWVQQNPGNSKAQSTLAYVCTDLWYQTHNKVYANTALTSLRSYLRVAPPHDGFRNDAQHLAAYMQSIVSDHA